MRKFIWILVAFCSTAVAQTPPTIIGKIRNRAQGEITFTSEKCSRDPTMNFAFIRDDGGRLSLSGCWRLVDYNVLVSWSDGDVYSYPVENVQFTPEYNAWYEQQQKGKAKSSPML